MSRKLCDDWDCPAQASCGHAFWRSKAYAEMRMPVPPTGKFGRSPGDEACTDYFTDQPRAWIREAIISVAAP
jgi:hypothetical protein